jgi:lipopolysaccharide biosynthesis protein
MIKKLKLKKWKKIIENSDMFDIKFYLFSYPDVRIKDVDAVTHYLTNGAREGRDPSEKFDTKFYMENNLDINIDKINPLVHYILFGKTENRKSMMRKTINELQNNDLNRIIIKTENKTLSNKKVKSSIFDSFNFQFSQNNTKSTDYIDFDKKSKIKTDIRLIAYYLPQFHPISQNDKAWGKGFTEWTNVSRALPQFDGHYQPKLPGELGFYDLRLKKVQERQIELARNYGLYGFCYHYYWFDGKKILDTPLQQVIDNPDLDFPFCINWANENWTKRWDGLEQEVILKQNHNLDDDIAFLEAIKPILTDTRYIRIDKKPLLMVYRPQLFPDIKNTVKTWRKHAKKIGIGELYLVLSHAFEHINPKDIGFDAAAEFAPNSFQIDKVTEKFKFFNQKYEGSLYDYNSAISYSISYKEPKYTKFRSLCPGWDNEARKPGRGISFVNSTPKRYSAWLEYLLYFTNSQRKKEEKLIFINAWNEWAEGAYLEPDRKNGYAYLDETYTQLKKFEAKRLILFKKNKKKNSDTAVILHLYYVDLWDEIKAKFENLGKDFDLYININNNADIDFIKKIKREFPNSYIYSCENRGRDILPFVEILKDILPLKYKYICKIHTKKSLHRIDGNIWRNDLINGILGSKKRVENAKKYLDEGSAIVVAKGNIFSYKKWKGSNKIIVNNFAKKANIKMKENFYFPAGSMFWFKPEVFEKLIKFIDLSEFDFEKGQIDGTKAHAVERIFGLLCYDRNEKISEI